MSTTSQSRKGITQHPTPYNVGATWSSVGQSTALWYLGAMTSWTEVETDTSEETMAQSVNTMTARRTSSSVTSNTTSSSTVASVRSTTNMPEQTLSSSASSPSTTRDEHAQPWCYIHGDSSDNYYCQCGDGSNVVTSPVYYQDIFVGPSNNDRNYELNRLPFTFSNTGM
ncbi:hypothetical protein KCU98_g4625, partial [Aureobasidium melanogenum]